MEMPPTSMYGDPHARSALDTLTAAHHAAAAQHMNHPSRHEKLHFHSFHSKIFIRFYGKLMYFIRKGAKFDRNHYGKKYF